MYFINYKNCIFTLLLSLEMCIRDRHIAVVIPDIPVLPVAFNIIVDIRSVAIAIPDTGLLEEPTSPTILADTVAKKKPNTTIINADTGPIGTDGIRHNVIITSTIPIITYLNDKSLAVRSVPPL